MKSRLATFQWQFRKERKLLLLLAPLATPADKNTWCYLATKEAKQNPSEGKAYTILLAKQVGSCWPCSGFCLFNWRQFQVGCVFSFWWNSQFLGPFRLKHQHGYLDKVTSKYHWNAVCDMTDSTTVGTTVHSLARRQRYLTATLPVFVGTLRNSPGMETLRCLPLRGGDTAQTPCTNRAGGRPCWLRDGCW